MSHDLSQIVAEQIEVLRDALLGIGDSYAAEPRCPPEAAEALPFLVFLAVDAMRTAFRDFEAMRAQRDDAERALRREVAP